MSASISDRTFQRPKSVNLNAGRSKKLNGLFVGDHFEKLLVITIELDIIQKLKSVYYIDEKKRDIVLVIQTANNFN